MSNIQQTTNQINLFYPNYQYYHNHIKCNDLPGNCRFLNQDLVMPGVRCRSCTDENTNNSNSSLSFRYQNLKAIQKTIRVDSSQYTMNLASVNSYDQATTWNNMSDRVIRHSQKARIEKGRPPSNRPGFQSPGGAGCDIKHNSYQRHLNRLKGNKILRAQQVPPEMALTTIPFNPAFPIYGNKLCKTSIINCFCR